MRQSFNEISVIEHEGQVIGVNLGFDFCAEHEWGFSWAHTGLGRPEIITATDHGVKGRTTTCVHENFSIEIVESCDTVWLRGMFSFYNKNLYEELTDQRSNLPSLKYRDTVSGWDGKSGFYIGSREKKVIEGIRIVYKALIEGRCFILQSGGVFGAGGLKLIDAAMIPDEIDKKLTESDLQRIDLLLEVAEIGIESRLRAAGKGWFALSPERNPDGSIVFWLNPRDQRNNNTGWFTVENLEAWIKNEGPIPIKQ